MNDTPDRQRHKDYPWCFEDDEDQIRRSFVFDRMADLSIEDKRGEILRFAEMIKTGKDPAPRLKAIK